jgi:hypothetical protein
MVVEYGAQATPTRRRTFGVICFTHHYVAVFQLGPTNVSNWRSRNGHYGSAFPEGFFLFYFTKNPFPSLLDLPPSGDSMLPAYLQCKHLSPNPVPPVGFGQNRPKYPSID